MHIIMAGIAIGERHIGKFLEVLSIAGFYFMALPAVHRFVLAHKGVVRIVVVKIFGWRKCLRGVAVGAFWPQCFLVIIFVAVDTGRTEAEVGFLPFFQITVINKIGDMALAAVDFSMRSGEVISRQAVVEIIFIEAHHIELSPVVVAVAGGAVFPPHFTGSVEARTVVDAGLYFGMAGEAFLVRDFISNFVALGAIGHAFEVGMGLGQVSGGKLSGGLGGYKQH